MLRMGINTIRKKLQQIIQNIKNKSVTYSSNYSHYIKHREKREIIASPSMETHRKKF